MDTSYNGSESMKSVGDVPSLSALPDRVLRLLHEIRDDISEQNAVRNEVWVTFPRQEQAISYQKEHSNVFIFSYQDHVNGQRRFVVSSYKEFWRRYKNMNPKYRHHYEVIQEGLPCHLYFDLEFNKIENSNSNGEEMVDILLSLVFDSINEKYSIEGDKECVVELDSSTEEKFSRHKIICFPNTAFKNNRHAGAFVGEICSRIQNERGRDGRFEKLFILKDRNSSHVNKEVFMDRAVYSRNRCFRLPLSSKARKTSILVPTGCFKCSEVDLFMASLICKVDVDVQNILICEMDIGCSNTLQFATQVTIITSESLLFDRILWIPRNLLSNSCMINSSRIFQTGRSTFPRLDMFVESVGSLGNISGKIHSWYWFSEYGIMVYNMSKNRYCERIGRQHKSNHVIYVVDIRKASYYQKCHDPDCRGYRSPLRPVPEEFVPDTTIFFRVLSVMKFMSIMSITRR
nr:PREDICTED: DNA-directed primase/polymerase protein-like [Daucus carota subsp. sativus]